MEKIDFRTRKLDEPFRGGLLGAHIRYPSPKDFQLRSYLTLTASGALPAPRPGPLNRVPSGLSQGMMLNDSLGDCVCACCGHMILNLTAIAQGLAGAVRPTDSQIEDIYCRACGYVRGTGEGNGCSISGVLGYVRQYGVAVGNEPVMYRGSMLQGPSFQEGENLVCKTVDPLRFSLVAYNSKGEVIPPSVMPIWALQSTTEKQSVSADGLTDTITGPAGSIGNLTVKVGAVSVGPLLISIAKDTGIFAGMSGGNLLVTSEVHPFQPSDVIVGVSTGAQFQVASDNVSVYPKLHRIFAYLSTQTQGPFKLSPPPAQTCIDEIKLGIDLFGGTCIGVQLMTYVQGIGSLWDVQSGTTVWGNHCVWALDYDDQGIFFVSWGRIYKMTWAFFLKYVFENWTVVSRDWIAPGTGLAPSGFNLAQLSADISALATAA